MLKKTIKKIIRVAFSPFILKDYFAYKKIDEEKRFAISPKDFYPQVRDKTIQTGFDRHYIYHTAWAARKVHEINPTKHIDISSSLYFCGIVSAFVPVDFYDYRPANLKLSDLQSKEGNLHNLPFETGSVKSISCMHTIEHVGLGRYGDPIDPNGDIKAIEELKRVTATGGNLLFVTPVGKPKIEFNAHRIYSYEQIVSYFKGFELKEFSLIPEKEKDGGIITNASPALVQKENYACGCFWFVKK
ncbi:MAG: DUF268 domain-containing protein [bacterium]